MTKEPVEGDFKGRILMSYLTELRHGNVCLGAAGKIMGAEQARAVLEAGCDYAIIGSAAKDTISRCVNLGVFKVKALT